MVFYIVVYLDVLFGINFLMDLVVLLIMLKIMRLTSTYLRLFISTTLGASWSVIAVLIPEEFATYVNSCTYICITILMVIICVRFELSKTNIVKVVKCSFVMLAVAMFLAGGIHMLIYYTYAGYVISVYLLNLEGLLIYTLCTALILLTMYYLLRAECKTGNIRKRVCIIIQGRKIELDGIIDTGNMLRDCISGKPVHVVWKAAIQDIISNINDINDITDYDDYARLNFHYTPYSTVGNTNTMMEVITADYMYIYNYNSLPDNTLEDYKSVDNKSVDNIFNREGCRDIKSIIYIFHKCNKSSRNKHKHNGVKCYENVLLGLSDNRLSDRGEYNILINVAYDDCNEQYM